MKEYLSIFRKRAVKGINATSEREELLDAIMNARFPEVREIAFGKLDIKGLDSLCTVFNYRNAPAEYRRRANDSLDAYWKKQINAAGNLADAERLKENNREFSGRLSQLGLDKKIDAFRTEEEKRKAHKQSLDLADDGERLKFLTEYDRYDRAHLLSEKDFERIYRAMSEEYRIRYIVENLKKNGGFSGKLAASDIPETETASVRAAVLNSGCRLSLSAEKRLIAGQPEEDKAQYLITYIDRCEENPFWYDAAFAEELLGGINDKELLQKITEGIKRPCSAFKAKVMRRLGRTDRDLFTKGYADMLINDGKAFAETLTREDADAVEVKNVYPYLLVRKYRDKAFADAFLLRLAKDAPAFADRLIEYMFDKDPSLSESLDVLFKNGLFRDKILAQNGRVLIPEEEIEREVYRNEYYYEVIPEVIFRCTEEGVQKTKRGRTR